MINRKIILSIITVLSGLLIQANSVAGVYKWVDENGQVHYGAQPGNTGAERVTIRQNETTKPRTIKSKEENAEQKKEGVDVEGKGEEKAPETPEVKEPEEAKVPKKEKRQLCKQATGDIANISSRGRMREINKKGEYTYLSEKQRQKRLSAARKKQREYCR
jgi:hypothetical protein